MVKVARGSALTSDKRKAEKDEKTAKILKKMTDQSIEQQASVLAATFGFPYFDLSIFPIDPEDVMLVPEEEARKHDVVLFHKKGKEVNFAVLDPRREESLEYCKKLAETKGWEAHLYVVSSVSLEHAWKNYKKRTLLDNLDLVRVALKDEDLGKFEADFGELVSLKENHSITTTRAMEVIFAGARKMRTSDIHIEPNEENARLRFRIDGVLQDIGALPLSVYRLLLSRVKMIGKMRINVRNVAQDGHFYVDIQGKKVDIRVSTIPGKFGENINMRLLSSEDVIVDVAKLGLRGLAYEEVLKQVEKPHGMILNTGPTGSGKTTTLYTLLHRVNKPGTKIITIEDPIEYSLPGIVQTEVSKNQDYTFATALRAVVRQDPDVLLVGEIRDEETADIAINAALTGHLVFSTLHTNSAPASIPRFFELGVKPELVASAINVLIGQRLVRTLCEKCKTSYEPAEETAASIIKLITIISPKAKVELPKKIEKLWKAEGCVECHMTGYRGRIGIFEVLPLSKDIIDTINNNATEQEIFKAALENGMVTMTQDGILKALEGLTTLDEVWRVTDQTDVLQNVYSDLMSNVLSQSSLVTETTLKETKKYLDSLEAFGKYLRTLESSQRLSAIFSAAILWKAGDIHIEPNDREFEIRFRIDGILQTVAGFPLNEYPAFLAEIKILGGLKTEERAGTTDSRFSITLEKSPTEDPAEKKIDVRLSIILGGFGETVVLRLLNQAAVKLQIEELGIRKENLEKILRAAEKPHGLILNTGPTGSGKTTTLYSLLSRLNKPEIKIITVEDPIEYQIPGLLQTQVKEAEGYTFATALRSLMRQNPDVLMVGEIRDNETAKIAIQAATTGHLVLSTLHANSAAGAVSRLLKMEISGDDFANATNLVFSQRLVRRLCEKCKKKTKPTSEEKDLIDRVLSTLSKNSGVVPEEKDALWEPVGCQVCSSTGYAGQMIISETLLITKDIGALIASGALVSEIEEKAVAEGMITLAQDGILAALEGKTTLEEVRRVTDL